MRFFRFQYVHHRSSDECKPENNIFFSNYFIIKIFELNCHFIRPNLITMADTTSEQFFHYYFPQNNFQAVSNMYF